MNYEPLSAGCAGQFYPKDAGELTATLDTMLGEARAPALPGPVLAVMVPHAGYQYSGRTASVAYRLLAEQNGSPDAILILSNSHTAALPSASVYLPSVFKTPLGDLPVASGLASRIQKGLGGRYVPQAHEHEHPLEVQFPFVQRIYPGVPVVPISLGPKSIGEAAAMARALCDSGLPKKLLLIASSDLSHFPSEKVARRTDQKTLRALETLHPEAMARAVEENMRQGDEALETSLCGEGAVSVVFQAAKILGAKGAKILAYDNSASTTGDPHRVVGYGAAAVYGPSGSPESGPVGEQEGNELLSWGRKALGSLDNPDMPQGGPNIFRRAGVFATLHKAGQLRGCIGWVQPGPPLGEAVWNTVRMAALEDPRFTPVEPDEIGSLKIGLSFLSEPRPIPPHDVIAGLHGVMIRWKGRQAVFLPEVGREQGWDRRTLIAKLIQEKAGFPSDVMDQGAELFVFTAQVFSEGG